jgi:glycyl-tRNA synthetase beta chain
VLNAPDDRKGSIRQGLERVLAARFTDAEFFWNADQKISLAARIPMLERVIYHEKLGTYGDKVRRMKVLAARICDELEKRGVPSVEQRGHALRAVDLCKCDLTTQMVQEFPELQGVIGGLYAQAQGEIQVLADAIYDQYKPVNVEDSCPRAAPGAIVSLADKLDSVVAGFSTGLEPTGSSDPFGLRRAGNGVIKLCLEALQGLDLWSLARGHADYVKQVLAGQAIDASWPRVEDFLRERMEFYFREVAGLRYDTARAVLRSTRVLREQGRLGHSGPADALSRAKALESLRDTDDFLALAAAAKRTRNIRKSATEADVADGPPDETQFTEERERELYKAYKSLRELLDVLTAGGKYEEAFRAMATIRPQVDLFFDKVLVMTEDRAVRRNRLRLLYWLHEDVFTSLADLAEITVESPAGAATGS